MTVSPSTTRSAGSVMVAPSSASASLSTVSTSSRATFSCLPPQRTIAYTRELSSPLCVPCASRGTEVLENPDPAQRHCPHRRRHSEACPAPTSGHRGRGELAIHLSRHGLTCHLT